MQVFPQAQFVRIHVPEPEEDINETVVPIDPDDVDDDWAPVDPFD